MKIAVCLFGQPRTGLYCAPWIKQQFNFAEYDSDTLVWGKKNHWHDVKYERKYSDISVDFFCDLKSSSISNNDTGSTFVHHNIDDLHEISKTFSCVDYSITTNDLDDKISHHMPFYSKMFSSMCRSVFLKTEYEMKRGIVYDAVFLHRYDVLVGPTLTTLRNIFHQNGVQPLCIYGGHTSNIRFVDEGFRAGPMDLFFWGDSLSIDLLCARLYQTWACNNADDLKHEFNLGPNTYLSIAMSDAGLSFQSMLFDTVIVRDTADLTRDVFESFSYHGQYWVENATWNQK